MGNLLFKLLFFLSIVFILFGCNKSEEPEKVEQHGKLFTRLTPENTGIHFRNSIQESYELNYLIFDGMYQGAGVAVGDINNDGLNDLYFVSNQGNDHLYLNEGNLNFLDITQTSGISISKGWSSGVSMADVNGDRLLDIYCSKFLLEGPDSIRTNLLFINNGDQTFTERAAEFGIDDPGYSVQGVFFDAENDGDLDLYVVNQPPNHTLLRKQMRDRIYKKFTDKFYINNGNGSFTERTLEAGLVNYAFGLSAVASDLNNDGFMDLYVANDYEEPDQMYMNNGDGTFTNRINQSLRHISNFGMGTDIADINNDGYMDIMVADMVAEDNQRLKTNMSGMKPEVFRELAKSGYHYQYMFNSLQLNNGNGYFSEIAQLAGVSNTDWSWSPLLADLDNDGFKDLLITNGLKKDMRDNDYMNRSMEFVKKKQAEGRAKGIQNVGFDAFEILDMAPSTLIPNYVFRNNGDLTFQKYSEDWGLDDKFMSQGAAYADLDNDGDLDIILNNMDTTASIYRNNSSENNFLRLNLIGEDGNFRGLGARIEINYDNKTGISEANPSRGFMSNSESQVHFGLGKVNEVDRVTVTWSDGNSQTLNNVKANQTLHLKQSDAAGPAPLGKDNESIFTEITDFAGMQFTHSEIEYDDYANEILIPHKMSHLGPYLAIGDVDGNGLDDLYIGGAKDQAGQLYLQETSGKFVAGTNNNWVMDAGCEDMGAAFLDVENDGDLDLYVVSGGNEYPEGNVRYQDRIYINDGHGNFSISKTAIPTFYESGSCVVPGDWDGDGDADLFIGGRQVPGKYPFPAHSHLLRNDNGTFIDITDDYATGFRNAGLVTSAVWTDYDNDGDNDLIAVGEWMAITAYNNDNGVLEKTEGLIPGNTTGWWNKIIEADMDNDGDMDYVAGNLGLNIKYKASGKAPFEIFCHDFDGNGTLDIYLGYYEKGNLYPVRGRECSSQQMPFVTEKFPTYNEFSTATVEDVLGEKINESLHYQATLFESVYLENTAEGFIVHKLPNRAQISTIFGIVPMDVNGDEIKDLVISGNYYEREIETTRSDASIGLVLIHDGKGKFNSVDPVKSGLLTYKDVRDMKWINGSNGDGYLIIANNNDALQVYKWNRIKRLAEIKQ